MLLKHNSLTIHKGMGSSIKQIIRLLLYFSLATTAVTTWSVSGWDGLACGDFPQVAKQFVWGQDDEVIEGCVTLDPGPKPYSMIAETDTDDVEVWAYALPGCRGSQKRVQATCTNPDILMFEIGFHVLHRETISNPNAKTTGEAFLGQGAASLHIITARQNGNIKYLITPIRARLRFPVLQRHVLSFVVVFRPSPVCCNSLLHLRTATGRQAKWPKSTLSTQEFIPRYGLERSLTTYWIADAVGCGPLFVTTIRINIRQSGDTKATPIRRQATQYHSTNVEAPLRSPRKV